MSLRLRPFQPDDEEAALAAHEALLAEHFHFLLDWRPELSWAAYLELLDEHRYGRNLSDRRVRATQLAVAVGGELVGRVSVRFSLNDFLAREGGHIGYGVLPAFRRRGYATEILRQALVILRADGAETILMTCDDDNVGSARVIEKNGGVLESVEKYRHDGRAFRRYWID